MKSTRPFFHDLRVISGSLGVQQVRWLFVEPKTNYKIIRIKQAHDCFWKQTKFWLLDKVKNKLLKCYACLVVILLFRINYKNRKCENIWTNETKWLTSSERYGPSCNHWKTKAIDIDQTTSLRTTNQKQLIKLLGCSTILWGVFCSLKIFHESTEQSEHILNIHEMPCAWMV